MQSSLRSFSGPRIKYTPEASPYEAITIDKLTPIIGARLAVLTCARRQTVRWTRSIARSPKTW